MKIIIGSKYKETRDRIMEGLSEGTMQIECVQSPEFIQKLDNLHQCFICNTSIKGNLVRAYEVLNERNNVCEDSIFIHERCYTSVKNIRSYST